MPWRGPPIICRNMASRGPEQPLAPVRPGEWRLPFSQDQFREHDVSLHGYASPAEFSGPLTEQPGSIHLELGETKAFVMSVELV
jgi:hypothetical protein